MRLISVTVENFRSITNARRIPISQLTTLVGPNNEGKSNILRALVIAINSLIARRTSTLRPRLSPISRRRRYQQDRYNWNTDCPIKLRKNGAKKGSTITLEFELLSDENNEFYTSIGSRLNGTLPISFSFDEDKDEVTIPKQGRGQKILNTKANKIAEFIAAKFEIQYIAAVRTAESAQSIVNELVERELQKIEASPQYIQALTEITALQEPILKDLSSSITHTMKEFLPNILQTRISIEEEDRSLALRRLSEIVVDDGAETPLYYKGDGVQSLAAIALMRHVSQLRHQGKEVIIALEEPESHLHPTAIRQLRNVLMELSTRHQVVLTTHNPLFTNRTDVHQNIIVNKNRAYPAQSVKEVRSILGVRLDDNLSSAEVILIVEGEEDKISLSRILPDMDTTINAEMKSGRLAIDALGGCGNLGYKVRSHSEAIGKVHVFLDDDNAGRQAVNKARKDNILSLDSINFSTVGGKKEAELEDLYEESVYSQILLTEVGAQMPARGPDSSKKWTDRLRNLLRRSGKPLDDPSILAIKIKVAQAASKRGSSAIHINKRGPLESLITSLKLKLASN